MTIEKLKSGSYRISETRNGVRHRLTIPYKPSKKEAYELLQKKIENIHDSITFEEAAGRYIDSKSKVLSPATIREYNSILRNIPDYFRHLDIAVIDDYTLQRFVNDHASTHAAKSTHNV